MGSKWQLAPCHFDLLGMGAEEVPRTLDRATAGGVSPVGIAKAGSRSGGTASRVGPSAGKATNRAPPPTAMSTAEAGSVRCWLALEVPGFRGRVLEGGARYAAAGRLVTE